MHARTQAHTHTHTDNIYMHWHWHTHTYWHTHTRTQTHTHTHTRTHTHTHACTHTHTQTHKHTNTHKHEHMLWSAPIHLHRKPMESVAPWWMHALLLSSLTESCMAGLSGENSVRSYLTTLQHPQNPSGTINYFLTSAMCSLARSCFMHIFACLEELLPGALKSREGALTSTPTDMHACCKGTEKGTRQHKRVWSTQLFRHFESHAVVLCKERHVNALQVSFMLRFMRAHIDIYSHLCTGIDLCTHVLLKSQSCTHFLRCYPRPPCSGLSVTERTCISSWGVSYL